MNVGGVNYETPDGIVDFRRYLLIGLMHGHWDLHNLTDAAMDGDQGRESINTGVGVVIPVQKIVETLYHPELVDMRRLDEKKRSEEQG